jgi:hypothetical protein
VSIDAMLVLPGILRNGPISGFLICGNEKLP